MNDLKYEDVIKALIVLHDYCRTKPCNECPLDGVCRYPVHIVLESMPDANLRDMVTE